MPTVVYIACAGPVEIHRFALDEDRGELEALDVVAVPGRDGPSPSNLPIALAPNHATLYAALRTPPYPATAFAIDPASGKLTARHRAAAGADGLYRSRPPRPARGVVRTGLGLGQRARTRCDRR